MAIRIVYVVHHSHTDIGYTHGQSRIIRWHTAFIRQAMELASKRPDFAWTCETFFAVEQLWKTASQDERAQFLKLVASGQLGVTAGYLHFTELPDAQLLDSLAARAATFASEQELQITSAMHADINGCSLIQARALAKSGVRFLLTCVHPHHGYLPFGKRQELFRWDLGDGLELLVCHADHYHTGNELGLAPGAEFNYTAGFTDSPVAFDDKLLETRLPAYLQRVAASGWQHDFVVIAVSGLCTDNSPPSDAIRARIERWNHRHAADVRVVMTTPARIFSDLSASTLNLQTYSGDWPDWWADGVAGDPEAVALFRQAQRDRRWLASIAPAQPQLAKLDQLFALFAEHTFGHSASVSWPWNSLSHQLRLKKLGYAADAADLVEALADQAVEALGGGALAYDRPPLFRVVNPLAHPIRQLVELQLDSYDSRRWPLAQRICVKDAKSGEFLPHQIVPAMRGEKLLVDVSLNAGQTIDLLVQRDNGPVKITDMLPAVPDQMRDLLVDSSDIPPAFIKTEHAEILWQAPDGIISWRDRATGRQLLDSSAEVPPFSIRASRLPAEKNGEKQCDMRRSLGRNRNGAAANWSTSKLARVLAGAQGEHLNSAVLEYELSGFELLHVQLNAHRQRPRVDVEVIMHKQGTWDAENVYLSLPFSAGEGSQLWLDRGVPVRPGIDQLPGTLIDFYGVQDGLAWCQPEFGLAIAQADSHLIQLGPLAYGARKRSGEQSTGWPTGVYAWLMTNYWETNFSPELAGFYSFRFSIRWGQTLAVPKAALDACRVANSGLRVFRLAKSK